MQTWALTTSFQQLVHNKIGPLTTHTPRKVTENKIFGFYSTGGPGAGSRLGHKDYTIAPDNIVKLGKIRLGSDSNTEPGARGQVVKIYTVRKIYRCCASNGEIERERDRETERQSLLPCQIEREHAPMSLRPPKFKLALPKYLLVAWRR